MRLRILRWGLLATLVIAPLVAYWAIDRRRAFVARREWKENAIAQINRLAGDEEWIRREIGLLQGAGPAPGQTLLAEGWLSGQMVLMKSGEWLVYQSHCPKVPPREIEDIFLALGSDGKWYYSTCHFCVEMMALIMVQYDQPPDLAQFRWRYHLHEFDGRSDECLKQTDSHPAHL